MSDAHKKTYLQNAIWLAVLTVLELGVSKPVNTQNGTDSFAVCICGHQNDARGDGLYASALRDKGAEKDSVHTDTGRVSSLPGR